MCQEGSTSLMRYKSLVQILKNTHLIEMVNIQSEIDSTPRLLRSLGWRYKIGPLIKKINYLILPYLLQSDNLDFVWIDKGVFIKPKTLKHLKEKTCKLIHFTPDPAFLYHKSNLFYRGLKYYSHVITTKSFELEMYRQKTNARLLYCTQGYDESLHYPKVEFHNKEFDVSFIGHYEYNRAIVLRTLLKNNFSVVLAGPKWRLFYLMHKKNKKLNYLGSYLKGESYTNAISNSYFSLGFLSKWIPEQHTTRTFEIPACGTMLLTEFTPEINSIFSKDNVGYYNNTTELIEFIRKYLNDKISLKFQIDNNYVQISNGSYTHKKIMEKLINELNIGKEQ